MTDHRCAECDKTPDETKFRLNGSGRLRKYCEPCSVARWGRLRKDAPPSVQIDDDTPRVADGYAMMPYQGAVVAWDTDGGMVCLTDLWRAAGEPENKEPAQWLGQDQAKAYIDACARRGLIMVSDHNSYSRRGASGGTWREKIIGLAYAQYLNADLAVACNLFILEKWGQSRQGGITDNLLVKIAAHLGILPSMDAKLNGIAQSIAGAERIEVKEYHRGRIYIGLLVDPLTIQTVSRELVDVSDDALIVFIGQTKPGEGQECLRIRDYTSKFLKVRPEYYKLLAVFDTDSPDESEQLILSNPPHGAQRAIMRTGKKSQSFHVASSVALDGYRQLSSPYYAVVSLQASWSITSLGPAQAALW